MQKIGFIGTGTIGGPIASRLLSDDHQLTVFDVSSEATKTLADQGASVATAISDIAENCETVFLSLPGPPEIESVVLSENGLLTNAGNLRTIVDLSTNAIALNREIAETANTAGIKYLDAPVSGGKAAAADGTLAVMIGGDESALEDARSLIERFGKHIFYLGPSGSGTLAKLINNQIFLSASVLVQEGFVMGAKAGMDPNVLLDVLKASSAGPMTKIAPLVLSRKFDLDVFALSIAAKDIAVALESADALGADTPMVRAASAVYEKGLADGLAKEDFYATIKVLEDTACVVTPRLEKQKK